MKREKNCIITHLIVSLLITLINLGLATNPNISFPGKLTAHTCTLTFAARHFPFLRIRSATETKRRRPRDESKASERRPHSSHTLHHTPNQPTTRTKRARADVILLRRHGGFFFLLHHSPPPPPPLLDLVPRSRLGVGVGGGGGG